MCCFTPDTSRNLPLCCACARHLPVPVHGNVVNVVDRLYLMYLHCFWWTVWAVGTFLCNITGTSISLSMNCSSRTSTCLANRLIFACLIVVGSRLRTRHRLEDLGELDLLAHLIDLLLDDRILSLRGVLDDLGTSPLHCVIFLMMLDCFTSTEFTTCWTCVFATCSPVHCWIVS